MTEKINISQNSEVTSDILLLDLKTPEAIEALGAAPIYKKTVKVQARVAQAGETIETKLANGDVETCNVTEDGDLVVTNPGGEEFVVRAELVPSRYDATEEEGVWQAKGMVRGLPNPTGRPVMIKVSWGEQYGAEDCMLTARYDPTKPDEIGPGRIVGLQEFQDTYTLVNDELIPPVEPSEI